MFDIETGRVKDFIKFDVGQLAMVTGGRNVGRVGTIMHRQKHKGSFEIIVVKDSVGHEFATRCASPACVLPGAWAACAVSSDCASPEGWFPACQPLMIMLKLACSSCMSVRL